ncbi:hypothetical protein [Aeromonas simiae]|uniref:hypothetical protein n=1 Tax=Aeromonas simiae TaxID=218936 RepID=UPI0012ECE47E|nr:hypothetical protein [Aeromonas simiae]
MMRFLLLSVLFFPCLSYSDEYHFKKITEHNSNEANSLAATNESKLSALKEAQINNKIYLAGNKLTIPDVCVVSIRSDLPIKRKADDIASIEYVKKNTGDNGEYLNVKNDEVDFIVRAGNVERKNKECEPLYHFAIKIGGDLVFDNNGWGVVYTSKIDMVDSKIKSNLKYNIGKIECYIADDDNVDYERHDNCIYNGDLKSAYREFYFNKRNEDGWRTLLPTYENILSLFESKKEKILTSKGNTSENSSEIYLSYDLSVDNSMKLISSMAGGETQVVFSGDKDVVTLKISYYAD